LHQQHLQVVPADLGQWQHRVHELSHYQEVFLAGARHQNAWSVDAAAATAAAAAAAAGRQLHRLGQHLLQHKQATSLVNCARHISICTAVHALRAAAAAPPMQKDAMMHVALLATATALSPSGLAVAECTITSMLLDGETYVPLNAS
jgi:hypothetical protein